MNCPKCKMSIRPEDVGNITATHSTLPHTYTKCPNCGTVIEDGGESPFPFFCLNFCESIMVNVQYGKRSRPQGKATRFQDPKIPSSNDAQPTDLEE